MKPTRVFVSVVVAAILWLGVFPLSGANKEMVQLQTQVQQLQEQMTACSAVSTSAWAS